MTWLEPQITQDPIPDLSSEQTPTEEPVQEPQVLPEDAPTMLLPELPPQDIPEAEPEVPAKETKPLFRFLRNQKPGMIAGIAAGVLVLALVLGVFIYGIVLKAGTTIYPNVYVAGIHVGGMDRRSAIEAVDEAVVSAYASSTLQVLLPDRTLEFTPDKTNVALDAEEAIDEAMSYGRKGNPFSAVANYYASQTREHYVDLQRSMDLDTDYIRRTLDEAAQQAQMEPSPGTASFNERAKTLTIHVGYPKRSLDAQALYDVVYNAFINSEFAPISWQYDEIPTQHADLTEYYETYCTPRQDAYFDEQTRTIVEAVAGYGFDLEDVQKQMEQAQPGSTLMIRMAELTPEITTEDVESEMFGQDLFSHSTEYVTNANRTKNLTLACQAIDGTILNPGDEFSFNNVVGERTAAKGYLPATVYSGGLSLEELGGGVCQVASTLYYCTLHLDLEQVHREPHVFAVTYVPKGMDATVYWGQIDYKFKNTLDFPIRILANTDDGHVNITFQGEKPLDYSVKMEETILAVFPWEEVEELDETKEPGYREVEITPYTGYRVVTYKTIYDADGNEISRKEEAKSVYSKRDQKVIVGPSEELPEDPFDPDLWNPDGEEDPDLPPEEETPDEETEETPADPDTQEPPVEDPWGDDPFAEFE